MKILALLAVMFSLVAPAHAVSEWGNHNAVVYLGTTTSGSGTFYVGTGNSRAAAGSILAFVVVSSPSAATAGFEVWDSSTTDLTGRSLLFGALCSTLGQYPIFREAQYGLSVVSRGCSASMSYLTHK